ncbi:MAG: GC-type dockerin domain-anchored protein [Planctomycetota bacterium]|nr:GC-type dockerin domain-anchored protein [Planctomycetota bacterium]
MLRAMLSSFCGLAARLIRSNTAPRVALALVACVLSANAMAVPFVWNGSTGDNLWSTPANWTPNGIPGAGDDVTIGAGASGVNISSANVTVATLDLQRPLVLANGRTLTVTTATLSASASISLQSGSALSGGTYTISVGGNISFPTLCSFARLVNVTINGDLPAFSGGMRWNNVTLNGTITAVGSATSEIVFEGTQTITGTITGATSSVLRLGSNANGTLTIASGAKVQGGNIDFFRSSPCLGGGATYNVVNNGTIDANLAGRTIDFNTSSPVALTNNGTVSVNGGTLALYSYSGAGGTLNLNSGTLNTFSTNPINLGTFVRNGGSASINGTCDLGGGTWTPAGAWAVTAASTLQNGTVNLSGGASFTFPALCNFARLVNLTINGDLPAFSGGVRWNNVTLNGTLTTTGSGTSEIVFEGTQTLTGTIAASTSGSLRLCSNANGTLTIASGAKIQGGNIDFYRSSPCVGGGGTYNVVNNGTIDANVSGRSIDFNTSSAVALTNNGTVNINGGTLSLAGYTSSTGTLNLNSGTFNFSGSLNALGTFTRAGGTGGTANLIGTSDLNSGSWTPIGAWNVSTGATVQNGTINLSGASNLTFPARCAYGRLSNVTVNGDITGFTGGMRWNNVTLNGSIVASGTSSPEIIFEGTQTLTGTISASTSGTMILSSNANGTLTIASGAKIQGGNIDFYRASPCVGGGTTYNVVNNGTIDANIAGRTIDFNTSSPVALTNNGTVNINGGTLSFAGFNSSTGTLNLNSGTFNFAGSLNALGTFNRAGGTAGTANLIGTSDLNNGSWTPTGTWNVTSGATIQNGTINLSSGNLTFPARCAFGRLSNIVLNGNLSNLSGGVRWNNVTLNGTLSTSATSTVEIALEGSQTLTGTFSASTSGTLIFSSTANGTLTIASGAKIQGGDIEFYRTSPCLGGGGTYSVVNNGLIDANIAGRAINFNTSSAVALTNNGTVNINGGTLTTNGFTNPLGTLNLNSGTLNFTGSPQSLGTFTRTGGTGGTANLLGTSDLGGGSWTPLGTWNVANGATLQNGTVTLSTGTLTFPARCAFGRLSNIALNGNLPAFTGGMRWNNVTLNGTITATGDAEIAFEGSQTITGTIASSTSASLGLSGAANGTLTIASGAKLQGGNIDFYRSSPCLGGGAAYNVVNNGTIDANIAGRSINFATGSPVSLTNNGTVSAGPGTVALAGGSNAGAFLARAGGTFSLGNFAHTFGPTSVLDVELKGPPPTAANFGRVTLANNAASTLALGGTLRVRNVAAYTPTCGLEWEFIKSSLAAAGTPITGTFSTFDFPFAGDGNLLRVTYEPKVVSYFIATQADFNQDGFITFEDFDAFVAAFEAGDAQSDFNLDGFLTFEDFDAFVAKFEGGC